MHLDTVIAVLIGILGVHSLGQRREGIGQTAVLLQFLTLLGSELALAGDVFQGFVYIDVASRLIEQGTSGIEACLDIRQHLGHCGELDNGLAKLLAVAGIGKCLVPRSLGETDALCSDTEAGTVHQRHHILDKAQFAVAAKLALSVLIDQFAGGRTVDAQLVLDTTHVHAAVALVIDEHGEAATIACASL